VHEIDGREYRLDAVGNGKVHLSPIVGKGPLHFPVEKFRALVGAERKAS
jgi:hypothetical protein